MPCNHRFLNLHRNDEYALFPDWEIRYLFVGTFNPIWDNPNGNNADYFYGRSRYFWRALSVFFTGIENTPLTVLEKIEFSRKYKIGFTDLFKTILNADIAVAIDRQRIFSFKDTDLEAFGLNFIDVNTVTIQRFIETNPLESIFFTLLSTNPNTIVSHQIEEIEASANRLGIPNVRLHSPTGQGLGKGSPRINKLIERWNNHGLLPLMDMALYPYT